MVLFSDIPYYRIDLRKFQHDFQDQLREIRKEDCFEAVYVAILEIDGLIEKYKSLANICEIRNTMDTNEQKYKAEMEFWAKISPQFEQLLHQFYEAILQTKYKQELEKYLGLEFFRRIEMSNSAFSDQIIDLMKDENQYSAEFTNVTANLFFMENGEKKPLSYLVKRMAGGNRQDRSKANRIMEESWAGISSQLDSIFDNLVQVRDKIAKKMGYVSYSQVAYRKWARTSYNREDIGQFRQAIQQYIVPILQELYERQGLEAGVGILYHHDEDYGLSFGEITPNADIVRAFLPVYQNLSPETHVYYEDLVSSGFYDIAMRPGKIRGAYCNMIGRYKMPFVFMTYDSTFRAVKTFAHETGHGFHSYLNRGEAIQFLQECSLDLAEIHSMAMEFLIWPYLNEIIPVEQVNTYKLQHLQLALAFIPYGCAVDEFQERIYDNPSLTCKERLQVWQELEKAYLPWRRYENDIFFAQGRFWQKQTHVFKWPFYYIDYVLAQVCAFQIHYQYQENASKGWQNYLKILRLSAYDSFKDTITKADLKSPFATNVMMELANQISTEIRGLKEGRK